MLCSVIFINTCHKGILVMEATFSVDIIGWMSATTLSAYTKYRHLDGIALAQRIAFRAGQILAGQEWCTRGIMLQVSV